MRLFKHLVLTAALAVALGAPQEVSYIRYFKTEDDLLRGVEMKPAEARHSPHIEALYNNRDGSLWKRAVADGEGTVGRMFVHGEEEMSAVFIGLVFPHMNRADFDERTTIYDYNSDGKVWRYQFLSLDHTPFGQIEFDFFEEGLVKEERWTDLLAGKTVRLFTYRYNPISREYTMLETDARGKEVSTVGIKLPRNLLTSGESEGGKEIAGNRLEESSEIIEDILLKRAEGWNPSLPSRRSMSGFSSPETGTC